VPIYRAHRRFIGPRWVNHYPDEKVNLHKSAIFPLKEYYNALVEYKYARKSVPDHRANSGIGKATALGLARTGATVVMVCRDRLRGEEAQQEINRR